MTKNVVLVILIALLMSAATGVVIMAEARHPASDHSTLYVALLLMFTGSVGLVMTKFQWDDTTKRLDQQDVVLKDTQQKMNGGSHAAEINELKHQFNKQIYNANLAAAQAEAECKAVKEQNVELKAENATLRSELARLAPIEPPKDC